ncbi:MAG: response regulator transcription factor, partial [Clostridia bacterium]|nr:response regulator transcription factor [Clostridia bacterium]
MKTKILLVDDDPNIRQLVNLYLEKEGFEVCMADRGDTALQMFRQSPPDLMLLDVMLPGMDGWQVLREARKTSDAPIIMLTAKDETFDKVLGLELGADDYVAKPFDMKELVARIKAVLRRFQPQESPAENRELDFPGLTVNLSQYAVTYLDKPLEMPPKELELLYFL